MMRLGEFVKTSVIGGVVVVLPVALLAFLAKWVFQSVTDLIDPLTQLLDPNSSLQVVLADSLVIVIIIGACFFIGVLVRTRLGGWIYHALENSFLNRAPGYSIIKETVAQFIGNKKSPFSSVALVQIFGNETLVSAFVTDEHADGTFTVFVPTGPNPTSGNIFHVKGEYVHPVDVPVEDAMRSIISCGAGSGKLVNNVDRSSLSRGSGL